MASEKGEDSVCAICEDWVNCNPQNRTSWRRRKINYCPPGSVLSSPYEWAYYHHSNLVILQDSADNGCEMCQLLLDILGISGKIDVLFDAQRKQKLRASHSSLHIACDTSDVRSKIFMEEIVKQIEYEMEVKEDQAVRAKFRESIFPRLLHHSGFPYDESIHKGQLEGPVVLLTGGPPRKGRRGFDREVDERFANLSVASNVDSAGPFRGLKFQVRVPCSSPVEFNETAGLWYKLAGTVFAEDKSDPKIEHRPSRDLMSKPHLDLIRRWRRRCLRTHEACARNTSRAKLPSRVIEIEPTCGEITEVIVIETRHLEAKQEYVCLSYCWGLEKQMNMTTMAEFPRRLILVELPATIADAIRLCHALNYRYLWVDSLCIIQGDAEDWKNESAQMCDIYGGSSLTIATEVCDASNQSFIHRRKDISYFSGPKVNLKSEGQPLSPRKCIWFHRVIHPRENSVWSLESHSWEPAQPLYRTSKWLKRAWTYQEWVLPSKVLHIDEMTLWDCFEGYANEITQRTMKSAVLRRDRLASRGDQDWTDIVIHYALRGLSKDIDRLPALAGVAQLHQEGTGHTYLAGLWLEEMPLSLMWYRNGDHAKRSTGYTKGFIPSWSWASVETSLSKINPRTQKVFASVKSYFCEYEPPGSFLQVKNAWLDINAPLKCIKSCERGENGFMTIWRSGVHKHRRATARLDVDEPTFEEDMAMGRIYALCILAWAPLTDRRKVEGLIVRENGDNGNVRHFQRLGYFSGYYANGMEHEKQLIRLI